MNNLLQIFSAVLGYGSIGYIIYYTGSSTSKHFKVLYNIFHVDSLLFVSLILLGIALISFGFRGIWLLTRSFFLLSEGIRSRNGYFKKNAKSLAETHYKSGENYTKREIGNLPKIWRKVIYNLERKVNPKDIMSIVQYEGKKEVEIVEESIRLYKNLAAVSSSVGVLGTIIGLIKLFKNMSDFSTIGDNMALAFLTTLYGVIFSAVIFTPVAIKMQRYKDDLVKSYMDAYYWLEIISERKPISYLDNKK